MRSTPDAIGLSTEYHGLYGWSPVRKRRYRQRRCQDGYGSHQRSSAAFYGDYWRFLRRRQLWYVWTRLFSPPTLDVAQLPYLGYGWAASRHCAGHSPQRRIGRTWQKHERGGRGRLQATHSR